MISDFQAKPADRKCKKQCRVLMEDPKNGIVCLGLDRITCPSLLLDMFVLANNAQSWAGKCEHSIFIPFSQENPTQWDM
jgi:hypothetical protein